MGVRLFEHLFLGGGAKARQLRDVLHFHLYVCFCLMWRLECFSSQAPHLVGQKGSHPHAVTTAVSISTTVLNVDPYIVSFRNRTKTILLTQ